VVNDLSPVEQKDGKSEKRLFLDPLGPPILDCCNSRGLLLSLFVTAKHITEKIRLKQSKETKATGTFTHDKLYLYLESGGVAAHAAEPSDVGLYESHSIPTQNDTRRSITKNKLDTALVHGQASEQD
jgi:hypothetical protein